MKAVIFSTTIKAFSGEGRKRNRIKIDGATVSVWDDVAGSFTTCHALTPEQIAKLRVARGL